MAQRLLSRGAAVTNVGAVVGRPAIRTTRLPTLMIALGMSCSGTVNISGLSRQRRSRFVVVASSSASVEPTEHSDDDDDEDIGLGLLDEVDKSELGAPPSVRYQRAMPIKERKVWRAKAENLAKEKRLVKIQVGQLGITQAFLRACADILQKHSLVRVKLGEGCGLERRSAAALLEEYLDCVCVHQIGFTITLYRQTGLPRPSNTAGDSEGSSALQLTPANSSMGSALAEEIAREKQARKKAGQQRPQQRPPEFSVLKD